MQAENTIGFQFKTLNILHIALCAGLVINLAIFRFLLNDNQTPPDKNVVYELIGIGISFIAIIAARVLFFTNCKKALITTSLKEKLAIFRGAFILQIALIEGVAIINCILYFITRNDLHFFIALGLLLLLIVRRPTKKMAAMLLFNNLEDNQVVYDDNKLLD